MAALFALDQNFPEPIVLVLDEFIPEVELVPLRRIDRALTEIDDWQVLLGLHHHERAWDGLITTDTAMLNLPREMAVIRQTNMTLVVAEEAGHDPIRATGLLFTPPFVDRAQYDACRAADMATHCSESSGASPLGVPREDR